MDFPSASLPGWSTYIDNSTSHHGYSPQQPHTNPARVAPPARHTEVCHTPHHAVTGIKQTHPSHATYITLQRPTASTAEGGRFGTPHPCCAGSRHGASARAVVGVDIDGHVAGAGSLHEHGACVGLTADAAALHVDGVAVGVVQVRDVDFGRPPPPVGPVRVGEVAGVRVEAHRLRCARRRLRVGSHQLPANVTGERVLARVWAVDTGVVPVLPPDETLVRP